MKLLHKLLCKHFFKGHDFKLIGWHMVYPDAALVLYQCRRCTHTVTTHETLEIKPVASCAELVSMPITFEVLH